MTLFKASFIKNLTTLFFPRPKQDGGTYCNLDISLLRVVTASLVLPPYYQPKINLYP